MKNYLFVIGVSLVCLGAVQLSVAVPAEGNAKSLATAEKAFAHEALTTGVRTGFLNVLSDDAIVFEPGPENGKKTWEARKNSEKFLEWQPVLAAVSTGGDLGFTTGPWSLKKTPKHKPDSFGQFVSIWRWENGKWKLIFDLGTANPAPTGPPEKLALVDNHAPSQPPGDAFAVMQERDREYITDRAANLAHYAEFNVRLYQPKKFPVVGKAPATTALREAEEKIHFGAPKGQISRGGDLGYLWGEYRSGEAAQPSGHYLRIWRKDRAGEWRLTLDLIRPR